MLKKIKNHLVVILAAITMFAPATGLVAVASAACNGIQNNVNTGIGDAIGTQSGSGTTCGSSTNTVQSGISKIASEAVTIFSVLVGVISVIMIIYGGFRYITSGGDSNKVGGAKNTLLYAIIGLVVVALAQLIVHYVLNTASNIS